MKESSIPSTGEPQQGKQISINAPRRSFLAIPTLGMDVGGAGPAAIVINSRLTPYFLNASNLSRTSAGFMELGLMMLRWFSSLSPGIFDLSVASNLGMCASLMAVFVEFAC